MISSVLSIFIAMQVISSLNFSAPQLSSFSIDSTIFFDDQHIGGYDEVRALEKDNKLQELLK